MRRLKVRYGLTTSRLLRTSNFDAGGYFCKLHFILVIAISILMVVWAFLFPAFAREFSGLYNSVAQSSALEKNITTTVFIDENQHKLEVNERFLFLTYVRP
jgi:hypothetical protein